MERPRHVGDPQRPPTGSHDARRTNKTRNRTQNAQQWHNGDPKDATRPSFSLREGICYGKRGAGEPTSHGVHLRGGGSSAQAARPTTPKTHTSVHTWVLQMCACHQHGCRRGFVQQRRQRRRMHVLTGVPGWAV